MGGGVAGKVLQRLTQRALLGSSHPRGRCHILIPGCALCESLEETGRSHLILLWTIFRILFVARAQS